MRTRGLSSSLDTTASAHCCVKSFTRFLRALDELQRKIMLDALAVTLGVGWVVGFAYFVANAAGLIVYDINIAVFPALLGVVYLIAFLVGQIRYR